MMTESMCFKQRLSGVLRQVSKDDDITLEAESCTGQKKLEERNRGENDVFEGYSPISGQDAKLLWKQSPEGLQDGNVQLRECTKPLCIKNGLNMAQP